MSYRKLLADRDNSAISPEQFSDILRRMHVKWGKALFGKRHGMTANTGVYSRMR